MANRRSSEAATWRAMIRRCTNPNDPSYANYGGRGVFVCDRWLKSFEDFLADMGPRPPGYSIDRVNNDGPYSPENCRWSNAFTQAANRSNSVLLTHDGLTLTRSEWARRIGINQGTIRQRLAIGWSIERALTTPRREPRKPAANKSPAYAHGAVILGDVNLEHHRVNDLSQMPPFGLLTATQAIGRDARGNILWEVNCECGSTVIRPAFLLVSGKTQSCGCLRSRKCADRNRTHNGSTRTEYTIWSRIKQRCTNPKCVDYRNYGGRGITLCDRWLDSFENFLSDLGPRPSRSHSVDRIDNNGPYAPGNCRWATSQTQSRNRRDTQLITAFGKSLNATDWAKETGLPRQVISARIRSGWPAKDALTRTLQKNSRRKD